MSDDSKSSINWGMLCHLAGLTTYLGIPLGNIIAPLVIWLLKKDTIPLVNEQGRESVNFNISYTLYALVAGVLCYVVVGFVVLPVVIVAHIVLAIRATMKANRGESVHYPFSLRFIN